MPRYPLKRLVDYNCLETVLAELGGPDTVTAIAFPLSSSTGDRPLNQ